MLNVWETLRVSRVYFWFNRIALDTKNFLSLLTVTVVLYPSETQMSALVVSFGGLYNEILKIFIVLLLEHFV